MTPHIFCGSHHRDSPKLTVKWMKTLQWVYATQSLSSVCGLAVCKNISQLGHFTYGDTRCILECFEIPFSLTKSPQPLDLNFWAYCIIIGFWFLLFGLKIHCNLWPYYCLLIFTFIPHQLCRCLRTAPTIANYRIPRLWQTVQLLSPSLLIETECCSSLSLIDVLVSNDLQWSVLQTGPWREYQGELINIDSNCPN